MEKTEAHIVTDDYMQGTHIVQWGSVPRPEAEFCLRLIEHWGALGILEGKDSVGRQRLLSPEELVDRAVKTTRLAYETMAKEDWFVKLPPPVARRSS